MNLSERELATTLAALRVFQRIITSAGITISPGALFDMEQFTDVEPLVPSAIDDLCERLVCEGGVGKYGHHPDAMIDVEVELDRLQGLLREAHGGLIRALDYRAVTPEGLSIKADIRNALERTGCAPEKWGCVGVGSQPRSELFEQLAGLVRPPEGL